MIHGPYNVECVYIYDLTRHLTTDYKTCQITILNQENKNNRSRKPAGKCKTNNHKNMCPSIGQGNRRMRQKESQFSCQCHDPTASATKHKVYILQKTEGDSDRKSRHT
jgi:hypothetical protein